MYTSSSNADWCVQSDDATCPIPIFRFSGADEIIYYEDGGNPTFTAGDVTIGLLNGGGVLNASAYFMGSYNFPDFAPAGSILNPNNAEPNENYDVRMAYVATGGM